MYVYIPKGIPQKVTLFDNSQGEFIETHEVGGHRYGLTMAAVEQVAHQGLACVTHMTLQVYHAYHAQHIYAR